MVADLSLGPFIKLILCKLFEKVTFQSTTIQSTTTHTSTVYIVIATKFQPVRLESLL
jgi:hypothetical protein